MLSSLIQQVFLCIPVSAADAAAVSCNGEKTLLANALITFFLKDKPVFPGIFLTVPS